MGHKQAITSPDISIIIPVYNGGDTIGTCIESILNQSFDSWEVIVVDDGSCDNTLDILHRFNDMDGRISYISTNHCGVANARNLALYKSKAPLICFMDADDNIEPEYLSTLYSYKDFDCVVCGYYVDFFNQQRKFLWKETHILPNLRITELTPNAKGLYDLFQIGSMHMNWNKLFRKDIIIKHNIKYKPYPVNEDYIFLMEYIKHCKSLCSISNPLYHWNRVIGALSGVRSTPLNIMEIYNEGHILTREFFKSDFIGDRILYQSYCLLVHKYFKLMHERHISISDGFEFLERFHKNHLVKESYRAYRPTRPIETLFYILQKIGWFRLNYQLFKLIN